MYESKAILYNIGSVANAEAAIDVAKFATSYKFTKKICTNKNGLYDLHIHIKGDIDYMPSREARYVVSAWYEAGMLSEGREAVAKDIVTKIS